jgi:hypothetical protein
MRQQVLLDVTSKYSNNKPTKTVESDPDTPQVEQKVETTPSPPSDQNGNSKQKNKKNEKSKKEKTPKKDDQKSKSSKVEETPAKDKASDDVWKDVLSPEVKQNNSVQASEKPNSSQSIEESKNESNNEDLVAELTQSLQSITPLSINLNLSPNCFIDSSHGNGADKIRSDVVRTI